MHHGGIVERAARRILRPPDHREQRIPCGRRRFVHDRVLAGADIEEEVWRHADHGEQQRDRGKAAGAGRDREDRRDGEAERAQQQETRRCRARYRSAAPRCRPSPRAWPIRAGARADRRAGALRNVKRMKPMHRRAHQQRQQVIRDRQALQVHDEQQVHRRAPRAPRRAPSQREPARRRDHEGADGVDLGLVRVLPVGEGERADDRRRRRTRQCAIRAPSRPPRRSRLCKDSCTTRNHIPAPAALNVALSRLVR